MKFSLVGKQAKGKKNLIAVHACKSNTRRGVGVTLLAGASPEQHEGEHP